jgi:predicted RNA-binding protein with RPS1 domain
MDSSEHVVINEVSSEQETKVDVKMINRDDIQEINLELDESQQEEDDNSSKKEKADNEWQLEDKKEEDEEYDDDDLEEEELHTLFNTTYTDSKMKSSCSSLKYVFDYIYHGSCLSRPRGNVEVFDVSLYKLVK